MGYAKKVEIEFSDDIECFTCGTIFIMQENIHERFNKQKEKADFYCPLGHSQHYVGKTDKQKLKEKEQELEWAQRKNDQLKNSERSLKGQITKLKKRTGNGVCPCCNRTFKQLARHMKCKHPNYSA